MKTQNHRRDLTITKDANVSNTQGLQPLGFRTPQLFAALLCLLLLTPASCSYFNSLLPKPKPKPADEHSQLVRVSGKARVLSIDKEMRYAVLDTPNGNKTAWWDNNTEIHLGDKLLSSWEAKPGDKIQISGFEANGEIFLRKVFLK